MSYIWFTFLFYQRQPTLSLLPITTHQPGHSHSCLVGAGADPFRLPCPVLVMFYDDSVSFSVDFSVHEGQKYKTRFRVGVDNACFNFVSPYIFENKGRGNWISICELHHPGACHKSALASSILYQFSSFLCPWASILSTIIPRLLCWRHRNQEEFCQTNIQTI